MKLAPPTPEKIREWIETDKSFRVHYFADNFKEFFLYHWGWAFKDFHHDWADSMDAGRNSVIKGFRSSRKTTLARGYVVWCTLYKKKRYIVVQSFEDTLSAAWVHQVAKMLFEESIVRDYGIIFPLEVKKEDLTKRSLSNFETTNGVKIESKSLGQTLRGANIYVRGEGAMRPDLLILDDLDTEKSVKNIDIIDETERKVKGETIGAMDIETAQIIFLANVINEDGVAPRFEKAFKGKKGWDVYNQPLLLPDGTNVWEEVFTPEIVAKLRISYGITGFNQNICNIPYVNGQTLIPKSLIRTIERYPKEVRVTLGIDPAFSLKTTSDAIGVVATWHLDGKKFILAYWELEGSQKQEAIYLPFFEQIYRAFKVSMIRIESNNGGEIIGRQLQAKGMAVTIITSDKDKVTRLKEKESDFTMGWVWFLPWTEELQDRIVRFPNVKKDDIVDAFVFSLEAPVQVFTRWL